MLKIYSQKYDEVKRITFINVIDNTLYILKNRYEFQDYYNKKLIGKDYLLKIDLNKRIQISRKKIKIHNSDCIIDKCIYKINGTIIDIYDLDTLNKIESKNMEEDYKFGKFITSDYSYDETSIHSILVINKEIYYVIKCGVYKKSLWLYNEINVKYIIKNINTKETYYIIEFLSNELKITEDVIYLPFKECKILTHNNIFIFHDNKRACIVKINLITKEIEENDIKNIYDFKNSWSMTTFKYVNNNNILITVIAEGDEKLMYNIISGERELIITKNYINQFKTFIFDNKQYYLLH